MKYSLIFLIILLWSFSPLSGQDIYGHWKTIDDDTNLESSIIEIYEQDGKVYGKVLELLQEDQKGSLCELCPGSNKNQPIKGMNVIKGLKKKNHEYTGGKILDPKNGKLYKCTISLEGKDKLKVRGYIGFSLMGRTQYWHRVN